MYRIIIVALIAFAISACQSSTNGSLIKSPISGYQYEHLVQTDNPKPNVGDFVYVNMDIYDPKDSLLVSYRTQDPLPSLEVLDQSDKNRKRNPLIDIVSLLAVGDSAAIIVPSDSVGGMPPGMEDVPHIEYHLVPVEILTKEEQMARVQEQNQKQLAAMEAMRKELPRVEELTEQTLKDYKAGRLDVKETPNGVKYYIHELGEGTLPVAQNMVTMNYYGRTVEDGKRFDDSFSRGKGYTFRVANDAVIDGWHEIAPFLPEGTKASVFIPSDLGYKDRGSPPNIGPGAELYFYMEVAELFY